MAKPLKSAKKVAVVQTICLRASPYGEDEYRSRGASLDALKESTRGLGIYPLAANMIHLFPLSK